MKASQADTLRHVDDRHYGARPVRTVRAGMVEPPTRVKADLARFIGFVHLGKASGLERDTQAALALIPDLQAAAEGHPVAAPRECERAYFERRRLQRYPRGDRAVARESECYWLVELFPVGACGATIACVIWAFGGESWVTTAVISFAPFAPVIESIPVALFFIFVHLIAMLLTCPRIFVEISTDLFGHWMLAMGRPLAHTSNCTPSSAYVRA